MRSALKKINQFYGMKKAALLLSIILLFSSVIGPTMAYVVTSTPTLVNRFISGLFPSGDLTIRKTIEHPFGSDYEIPENISFDFAVNLSGDYAGKRVETSQGDMIADENGNIYLAVKPGSLAAVYDLDAGTVVTVTEQQAENDGFSVKDGIAAKEIAIEAGKDNTVGFVNTYAPAKADTSKLNVTGTKTLTGREWKAGDSFTFQLEYKSGGADEWSVLGTKTVTYDPANPAFWRFDFGELVRSVAYDQQGIYSFRVSEIEGSIAGITYDKVVSYFDVKIGDADMDGSLEIQSVTGYQNASVLKNESTGEYFANVVINNEYAPEGSAEATIDIFKKLNDHSGQDKAPAGFTFHLYNEDGSLYKTSARTSAAGETAIRLTYGAEDAGKSFVYTLKENNAGQTVNGMTYDASEYKIFVSVVDNLDGTISAVFTDGQGAAITESEAALELAAEETEESAEAVPEVLTEESTEALSEVMTEESTEALSEVMTEESTEALSEVMTEESTEAVSEVMTEESTEALSEVMTEESTEVLSEDTETMTGVRQENTENAGYTEVSSETLSEDTEAATEGSPEGEVSAEASTETLTEDELLSLEESTKTSNEIPDTVLYASEEEIELLGESSDDIFSEVGSSELTLVGFGAESFELIVEGIEEISAQEMETLMLADGEELSGEGGISGEKESGGDEVLDAENDAEDTETLNAGNAANIYKVTFTNTYNVQSAQLVLVGDKNLDGREMQEGEFKFCLYETNSDFMVAENADPIRVASTINAEGSFAFEAIAYEKTGTHYYVVVEDDSSPVENVKYDTTKYFVTVRVIDEEGVLKAVPMITNEFGEEKAIVFNNIYEPETESEQPPAETETESEQLPTETETESEQPPTETETESEQPPTETETEREQPPTETETEMPTETETETETLTEPETESETKAASSGSYSGNGSTSDNAAQTGDTTNIVLYLILAGGSAILLLLLLGYRRRKAK